jgi:esterase/lipase superfamily enzyme
MHREYHGWYSERLGRKMELYLYGHGGEPVILFPTSRGHYNENEDFQLVGAIADRIDHGRYLVCCIDAVDEESWYNKGIHPADRVRRHEQYESYIVNEVVPLVRARSSGGRLTLGGCSFGGFHTMQIGLRNPWTFQRLLSMSGKYDTESFLDGWHDQGVYYNSLLEWLPNLTDSHRLDQLHKVEIILATGDQDMCREANEKLSALLWKKGIGNHLSIWDHGIHDWPLWRREIREYLPW